MAKTGSSVVVLALKTAVAVFVSLLAQSGCVHAENEPIDRHVVPNGYSQVVLQDFDIVSFLDVDLYTAVETREAVESEFKSSYGKTGHPRWFFHAFDGANLDFVVARYEPRASGDPRYVAERRLRVKRSRAAERALGVTEVVKEYEIGTRGVKAGMSRREVVKIAGKPEADRPAGPPGAYDMRYAGFCAHLVDGKVLHVGRRDQCL